VRGIFFGIGGECEWWMSMLEWGAAAVKNGIDGIVLRIRTRTRRDFWLSSSLDSTAAGRGGGRTETERGAAAARARGKENQKFVSAFEHKKPRFDLIIISSNFSPNFDFRVEIKGYADWGCLLGLNECSSYLSRLNLKCWKSKMCFLKMNLIHTGVFWQERLKEGDGVCLSRNTREGRLTFRRFLTGRRRSQLEEGKLRIGQNNDDPHWPKLGARQNDPTEPEMHA